MSKIKLLQLASLVILLFIIVSISRYTPPQITVDNNNSNTAGVVGSIPGIDAYFSFDEGSGNTVSDTVNNRSGALTNGPSWTSGRAGGGISLDGLNDYVLTNYSPKFNSTGFTVSLWVNPSYLPTPVTIGGATINLYSNLIGDSTFDLRAIRIAGNNKIDVLLGGLTSDVNAIRDANINLSTGSWQMITVTYDASNKSVSIYQNGSQTFTRTLSSPSADWGGNVTISKRVVVNEYLRGSIDEVRFYNRPLSSSEVSNLYSMDLTQVPVSPTPSISITPIVTPTPIVTISQSPLVTPTPLPTPSITPTPTTAIVPIPTPIISADTISPVISNASALSITATSTNIAWTTNEASDTQIEYGVSSAYGIYLPVNTAMVTSHMAKLINLTSNTIYYVKIKSKDYAGNTGISTLTFKTLTLPIVVTDSSKQADLPASFQYIGNPLYSRFSTDPANRKVHDLQYWPVTDKIYIGAGNSGNGQIKTDLWSLNVSNNTFTKEIDQMDAEMIERFRVLAGQLYIPAYDDVLGLNFHRLDGSIWKRYPIPGNFGGHSPDLGVFDNKLFITIGRNDVTDPGVVITDLAGKVVFSSISTTSTSINANKAGRIENFFDFKGSLYANRLISLTGTGDNRFLSKYDPILTKKFKVVYPTGAGFFPEYPTQTQWMSYASVFKGAVVYGGFNNLHYATSIEPPVVKLVKFPSASMSVVDFFDRDGLMFVLGKNTTTGLQSVIVSPDLINWTPLLNITSKLSFSSIEYVNGKLYLAAEVLGSSEVNLADSNKYTGNIYMVSAPNLPSSAPSIPGVI
jgi:hypothetical protein